LYFLPVCSGGTAFGGKEGVKYAATTKALATLPVKSFGGWRYGLNFDHPARVHAII
jgi:hypothetical protein